MQPYLDLVDRILTKGELKKNRTGIDAITITGAELVHDMSTGYPLLTTKKVPFRLISSELEFFIKGITDKKWLQDRNNHIWDEWCSSDKVPYGTDEETKKRMAAERELGPVYGWQWRHFGARYTSYDTDYTGQGIDQLANVIKKLKADSSDRRMIVSAWNPIDLPRMALPPCHYSFHVSVLEEKLDLIWNIRSVDTMLGLPFNIASYALLLHLLAKETNLKEGKLVGHLEDTHIYVNHVEGAKEQLKRKPHNLPQLVTEDFKSILNWEYNQSKVIDYNSHPPIKFEIAV